MSNSIYDQALVQMPDPLADDDEPEEDYDDDEPEEEEEAIEAEVLTEPFESDLCYEVSAWPRLLFDEALHSDWSDVRRVARLRADSAWTTLMREVFARLYGVGCAPLPDDQLHKDQAWARKLHDAVVELPEWRDAVGRCEMDELMSAIGASCVSEVLHKRFPKEELGDVPAEERRLEDLKALVDPEQEQPGLVETIERQEGKLDLLRARARKASNEIDENMVEMRSAVREALQEFIGVHEAMEGAIAGLTGGGAGLSGPTKNERIEWMRMIASNAQLLQILDMAGRMRATARQKQRSKLLGGSEEVVAIELGGDLARLVPSELMQLRHPKLRTLLYGKLIERNAIQYEMQSRIAMDKGPILFVLDESGSMAGAPNVYAKAAMFGMLQVAIEQRRDYGVVHFSSTWIGGTPAAVGKLYPHTSPATPKELLEHASSFMNGGTDFNAAITVSHQLMEKSPTFGKADLVLYTDAMAPYELNAAVASLKNLKAKADFQLHVVHVVASAQQGAEIVAGCGKPLKELADSWVTLPSNETSLRPMDALFSI